MKLIKLDNKTFRVSTDTSAVLEGEISFIREYLVNNWSMEESEIDLALRMMEAKRHDTAHFGDITCSFMFTSKQTTVANVVAELNAIQDAREEFTLCYKVNSTGIETRAAAQNLQTLYIALNVPAVLDLLGHESTDYLSDRHIRFG